MRRIGIDVGGTNTDAALIDGTQVIASVKTPTTEDVTSGIRAALSLLLERSEADPSSIDAVMIGTTHFTNAVVQRRDLARVAAIRIGLPAAATLEPFIDWPADLRRMVQGSVHMVRGGHEVDGLPIVPLDRTALREIAEALAELGIEGVGICSVFSPLDGSDEDAAARIMETVLPGVAITRSHDLGRLGLLARENVTLLNASLARLARRTTRAFADALQASGIQAQLYLTQNDGTVMLEDYARRFPVLCFASGPTNSLRGAAFLSGIEQAMVIDVGGTTTDVGCLQQGFPREANNVVEVGGVRTLFRMPDLLSIGLGGGSLVDPADPTRIGPQSVGFRLTERARVFGGDDLTATDVAVAAGLIELGEPSRVADLDPGFVATAIARMHAMIEEAVDRMKPDAREIPLIAVGGGSFLVPGRVAGISEVVHVPHHEVANAVGAAIAQVSGEVDQIFQNLARDEAITQGRQIAEERAVTAGARRETLQVIEIEDLPLTYLPGNSLRIRVRVVGDIA
jgi:N-methylhydantoinase A/oxoprolinase/acetone carboxylase beta subunit